MVKEYKEWYRLPCTWDHFCAGYLDGSKRFSFLGVLWGEICVHMLASRAAPPNSAPMAMAPVCMGAALLPVPEVVVVLVVWVEVVVGLALVSEAISDEMDDSTLPVAVLNTDSSDDSELLRAVATELIAENALSVVVLVLVLVLTLSVVLVLVSVSVFVVVAEATVEVWVEVVVLWAAAREATARTAMATRILAVC